MAYSTSIIAKTADGRDVLLVMDHIAVIWAGKSGGTVIVERVDGDPIEILGTVAALSEFFSTYDMRPKNKKRAASRKMPPGPPPASVVPIRPRGPR